MKTQIIDEFMSIRDQIEEYLTDTNCDRIQTITDLEGDNNYIFDVKIEVTFIEEAYHESNGDVSFYNTGEVDTWRVLSAIVHDEDDNKFEISENDINEFNTYL